MNKDWVRSLLVAAVAVVIGGLASTGVARAGQIVYPSGSGIWVMNDDGSGKRQLVDVSQASGMEFLGEPSVQPGGNEVAFVGRWNQASAQQNAYYPAAPGFCGGNCEGIYELAGGAVTRISPAPFGCGAQPCASEEHAPRVAKDGSVAYVQELYVSEENCGAYGGCTWDPIKGSSGLFSRDSAGNNNRRWATACDGTNGNNQITDANVLAVDPLDPNRIVYGNCAESSTNNCYGISYTTAFDVFDSGPSAGSAADDKLLRSETDPNAKCLEDAGTQIGDLDFSPDATQILETHGGTGAGLYAYSAADGSGVRELMAIPNNWSFYGARYLGSSGRVGLIAGPSADKLALYSMSASCTPATCDVSTGAGVTPLTTPGQVDADYVLGESDFGYTSSTTPIAAVSTSSGSGTGSGGSGSGGQPGSGSGSGSGTGKNSGTTKGASAPNTKITKVTINHRARTATFRIKGSGGSGKLTYKCRLDKGRWTKCGTSVTYKHLRRGKHTFAAQAVDHSGKADRTPASKKFKV